MSVVPQSRFRIKIRLCTYDLWTLMIPLRRSLRATRAGLLLLCFVHLFYIVAWL